MNTTTLDQWIGNQTTVTAEISPVPACQMAATLDLDTAVQVGDPLPPGWHWLYFREPAKTSALGPDGHAELGGFMPLLPLPRRMWAGGRIQCHRPLRLGNHAERRSTITSITPKEGRSGALCFVEVTHEITVAGTLCLTEIQSLVYREAAPADCRLPTANAAPTDAQFSKTWQPSSALLFRYSALTFNSHRIHYDVDYCRDAEGYPDLVVHGPLIATLLLDLFHHQFPDDLITDFRYRARMPLFHPHPFAVHGTRNGAEGYAWAADMGGGLAMDAEVNLKRR
ncbi:MAG: MaoC family dehydratase N-terminal domain-containing protein [Candidatus Latescibacteria bacterium]|nr:MaoC family dehydratase N-terminal domain-containing protein [Candidatus Latescibacterota bacterium]